MAAPGVCMCVVGGGRCAACLFVVVADNPSRDDELAQHVRGKVHDVHLEGKAGPVR